MTTASLFLTAACQEGTPMIADSGKERLIGELDKLPNSDIKTLLQTRVKPLFESKPPTVLSYDGQEINVVRPVVVLKTVNINSVSGLFTPRDTTGITPEPLYPTKEVSVRLPYLGLTLDTEKSTIPASNLGKDGTPLLDIDFPTNKPFYEGLRPVITITTPNKSVIKQDFKQWYKNMERFCYVKEACSSLLVDLYISETVKKMRQLDLSITLEAKRLNGTTKQAEVLTQALTLINNTQGRVNAAIDLAGYLLAYKATEGTEIDDPKNMDQNFAKLRPNMAATKLGSTSPDILYNSLRWAITTKDADKLLVHVGNINNIP